MKFGLSTLGFKVLCDGTRNPFPPSSLTVPLGVCHYCTCASVSCTSVMLSFPVFSLCCYICRNADACLSRSVETGSCSTHLMYSQLIAIFIFPWNPMCNQMSAVMSSFDALCSSCFSCCTYFTWLCSIPRKWLIKSFLYCTIKSSFKIWLKKKIKFGLYSSFISCSAILVIHVRDWGFWIENSLKACKNLLLNSWMAN